jgi:nucleoside-diphosphate-sugar epimerase
MREVVRVLILGGSWFVGRAVVESAVARGHDVTVFNRGRSPAALPGGVRHVMGDREKASDLKSLVQAGPWDAAVDVSGSVPAVVARSAELLAPAVGHCTFVSTISAYRDWPHTPIDEDSPLWDGDPGFDPLTRRWDPDAYGPLKVGCEMACREAFGEERLLVLRPHVVLGPHEYVGRLQWWLARLRRGGQILAPAPNRGIQPIDARDLSGFLLDQVERHATGVYNVAPDSGEATFGDMLNACHDVVGSSHQPAEFVWVDENWLTIRGVTQWTELPLWRNAAAPWSMKTDRARAAGLRCRPLAQTVADTWAWLERGGQPVTHERFGEHGIDPVREETLLRRWLTERRRP